MKKKSVIAVLLVMAMCFSLCACGGGSDKRYSLDNEDDKVVLEEAMGAEEVLECSKYIKINETSLWCKEAKFENVFNYEDYIPVEGNAPLGNYINALGESADGNEYVQEITARYNELDMDNQTDFTKDMYELFAKVSTKGKAQGKDFDFNEYNGFYDFVGYDDAWIIGYENEQISGDTKNNARVIILNTQYVGQYGDAESLVMCGVEKDGELQYVYRTLYTEELSALKEEGTFKGLEIKTYTTDSEEDKAIVDQVLKDVTGTQYVKVTTERIDEIENAFMPMQELLNVYCINYWNELEMEFRRIYFTTKSTEIPDEPEVGMTKEELVQTEWGYPQDKNITKYEGGTKEQWVYENEDAYVYITNDVVTSISYR